jgi:hypothetical protein
MAARRKRRLFRSLGRILRAVVLGVVVGSVGLTLI